MDLLEAYVDELWPTDIFVGYVWDVLQRSTVYPGDLHQLLQRCFARYREGLDLDDVEDHNIDKGLVTLSEELERRWSTEWLTGHIPTTKESTLTGRGDLDPVAEFQKLVDQGVRGHFKPRPLRIKAIILLHLFSGHRRPGDVQEEFERLQSTSQFPIYGVSVDVVISMKYGNLLDPAIQRLFLNAIADGHISSVIAGPPCETWSQAREQYYIAQRGPRPVRTVPRPQGMDILKLRELAQIIVGNDLLGIAFTFGIVTWIYGCFMMLEHPKEPESEYSCSIWKLAIAKFLLAQAAIKKLCVCQGYYGAPSSKPTTLMCVHATADIEAIFFRCRIRSTLPHATSIGVGADGKFRTQALKAYPRAFCVAIAQAAYAHVLPRGFQNPDESPPVLLQNAIESLLASAQETSTLGPDYCKDGEQVRRHDWRSAAARL